MSRPRAVFVDDEPRILDGLRRSLRGKRAEWDMAFASGGAEALELLAAFPADVVVSDMRMPGMDGADLLTAVSRRHPEVARVILSGHIEPEAASKVAVAGHRFLTKPCEVQSVIAVVEQLLTRTSPAPGGDARRIAGGVRAVPPLPEHAAGLAALCSPEADLTDAVQTALHDVGLSAKLLQLSNSTFFGARPRNSSIESVVTAMGLTTIQAVVGAARALWSPAPWDPVAADELRTAWRHSVATAVLTESVASPASRPYAQAAALLQDIGRLVCLGPVDAGTPAAGPGGVPFREVGVELLHLWGLPPPIVAAVARRDTGQRPDPAGLGVPAAVRAAHLLLQRTESADPSDTAHDDELADLLAHPQMTARGIDWRRAAQEASDRAGRWRPGDRQ